MLVLLRPACLALALVSGLVAEAQIVAPSGQVTAVATLSDQLINRLRATTGERRAFVREVVRRTEIGQLDRKLLLAVQRYAIRRNSEFPFPFFEKAIRFEAAKRGVQLPVVQTFIRAGDVVR